MRYHAVHRNEPGLLSGLPKRWRGKLAVPAADLGLTTSDRPVPLAGAYVVHIDDRMPRVDAEPALTSITRTHLHENLSRLLRGACQSHLGVENAGFRPYVPSLDCEGAFHRRLALMSAFVDHLGVTSVSGPAGGAAEWITVDIGRRRAVRPADPPAG